MFLQYEEQDHGFASIRGYAERLGGRLIVEPTGPVWGASVTGAAGYLQKVSGMDWVLGMVRSAAAGEGRLQTEVVRWVFRRIRSGARAKGGNLAQREKEILVSLCRGKSYVAIAAEREVKVVTVRNAIYTIQVELGVSSKQEVVSWAAQNELLDD